MRRGGGAAARGIVGSGPAAGAPAAAVGSSPGRRRLGYVENFAWGFLHIADGNSLVLVDGNATPGGALYVGEVTGVVLSGSTVTNVSAEEGFRPRALGRAFQGDAAFFRDGLRPPHGSRRQDRESFAPRRLGQPLVERHEGKPFRALIARKKRSRELRGVSGAERVGRQ